MPTGALYVSFSAQVQRAHSHAGGAGARANKSNLALNQYSYNLFKNIAAQAKDLEVKKAILSGGEPLLSENVIKMVDFLISYDMYPYSNQWFFN